MSYKHHTQTFLFGSFFLILAVGMMLSPKIVFDSSLNGVKIWWEVVFPAVFPFMILSELMIGFGVVHFLGVWLEPLMRPLFKVPGAGGFVMAMGFASSYPVGPKLATTLREREVVSRSEGERLVCFTSTADPLFIFVAISVGIFHDAAVGVIIAASNYLGAILLGIILRFHDRGGEVTKTPREKDVLLLIRAYQAMRNAQIKEKRSLGELMGDAIMNSFYVVCAIGGFIIIFSVIIRFITMGSLDETLTLPLSFLFSILHIPQQMSQALVIGFFEVTQSAKFIGDLASHVDLKTKIAFASALVAWGGISVHAQVASIISSTDMRYKPYFLYKGIHACLSGVLVYLLWEPLQNVSVQRAISAFTKDLPASGWNVTMYVFHQLGTFTLILLGLILLLSVVPWAYKRFVARYTR